VSFYFLGILILGTISCKKQDKHEAAQIEVISPIENSVFTLPGAIKAEIVVTAAQVPDYIRVCVCNSQQTPVFQPVYFYPDSLQTFLSFNYSLNKSAIEAEGQLYFQVTVVVAGEADNSYTKIGIESLPIEYKGFYLFTRPTVNETNIFFVDASLSSNKIASVSGNFLCSMTAAMHDMLFFISTTPDRIYAHQFDEEPFLWDIEPSADFPKFYSLFSDGNTVFCGYGNGKIAGFYDVSGQQIMNTLPKIDSVPEKLFTTDRYLFGDFRVKNKITRSLSVFYKTTGVEFQRTEHSIQVVDFYIENGQNDLFVFGNENGKSVFCNYFPDGNYFSESVEMSGETMNSSCRAGETIFLFSVNKKVYSFNTQTLAQEQLISLNDEIVSVDFDETQQIVFVATANSVYFYAYPAMQELTTYTSDEPIKGIILRYAY